MISLIVNKIQIIALVICLTISTTVLCLSSQIPDHLIKCYSVDYELQNVHNPPFEPRTLSELIRKLEQNRTEPNIRLITNAILHVAKFDGVQHASVNGKAMESLLLQYRASGPQFHKHSYIVDNLTSNDNVFQLFPQNVLTDNEFCLLHFLLSDTLDLRLRGDESKTCPISISTRKSSRLELEEGRTFVETTNQRSDCPELKGVMNTKWGTVSPGFIIAGIASAFERTEIDKTSENYDDIDSIWFSTLGGVLAHVVINQVVEKPRISAPGKWNDNIKPGKFYLKGNYWDGNDALLLGAIDGLILASEVRNWYHQWPAVTLSQLISSYYSSRGVPYNNSIKACNRLERLGILFDEYDFVKEVTAVTKKLNNVGQYEHSLVDDKIDGFVQGAIEEFKTVVDSLMQNLKGCSDSSETKSEVIEHQKRLEVIIIADQSYTQYQMEQVFAYLGDQADVSHYSSRIGLISGTSGQWLVNITDDILEIYNAMSKINKNDWPTGLSLTPCLHRVITHYQNVSGSPKTKFERPHAKVLVILGQSSYLTDTDLAQSIRSLESIRNTFPEVRVILATDSEHARTYGPLIKESDKRSKLVIDFKLKDSVIQIAKHLNDIPATIIDVHGNASIAEFEDYLTPNMMVNYEIDQKYLQLTDLKVTMRSRHPFTTCVYSQPAGEKQCRWSRGGDELIFRTADYCPSDANRDGATSTCTSAMLFTITTNDTTTKCPEFACRYPDQVLINIRTSWTRSASPTRLSTSWSILFLVFFNVVRKQY